MTPTATFIYPNVLLPSSSSVFFPNTLAYFLKIARSSGNTEFFPPIFFLPKTNTPGRRGK